MIVAFTGHRPDKLGGYNVPNPTQRWVSWLLQDHLQSLRPTLAISGMAQGVDQWAARACIDLGIPFIAAIPFVGQEKMWPEAAQKTYRWLLMRAHQRVVVCKGSYAPEKMQKRNQYMVDECSKIIAVWDGAAGGTANCVKYAEKKGKTIIRIIP